MYAPEGFVSLAEIEECFGEIAENWRDANPHPDDIRDQEPNWLDFNMDPGWRRELAYRIWALFRFIEVEDGNFFIALGNGTALKVARSITRRHHFWSGPFDDTIAGWEGIIEHMADPFSIIDRTFFTVDLKRLSDWWDVGDYASASNTLVPLDNCPVCWKLPPNTYRLSTKHLVHSIGEDEQRRGRPPKVGLIAAAYQRRFPEGHGSLTRKHIITILSNELDIAFGEDTLDRAVKVAKGPQNIR